MALATTSGEKKYTDLSKARRWFLLILVSMGSSVIYGPIYLKIVFYDPLMAALNVTNEQLGFWLACMVLPPLSSIFRLALLLTNLEYAI